MSRWSMTAMSPGWRRLVRFLVRASTRAGPTTPGPASTGSRRRKIDIGAIVPRRHVRSEEHTSELQSRGHLVCRLLLEKKNQRIDIDGRPYTESRRCSNAGPAV